MGGTVGWTQTGKAGSMDFKQEYRDLKKHIREVRTHEVGNPLYQ